MAARSFAPLEGGAHDWEPLLARIGDARFVLLGEATHGTHEFYRERARLTKELVLRHGFDAIAIEADWPDAYRVHRWVTGQGDDADADQALAGFRRFPTWMWRNHDVRELVTWLRDHNRETGRHVGFFGLDLYSLYASIESVVHDLDRLDPDAAAEARRRYACFDRFDASAETYGMRTGLAFEESCARAASAQVAALHAMDGKELFGAEQNARVVAAAEHYYRRMFAGGAATWNIRDRHMADTLAEIAQRLDRDLGRASRIVVWEHNSHLGDARATQMADEGELNVGQLVRERWAKDSFLVGLTTYEGTVVAASDWDRPGHVQRVRPALPGSFEALLHEVDAPEFLLLPDEDRRLPAGLRRERLERAIGVVYRPETERASHWFRARLGDQFDAVLHIDKTSAVVPLDHDALPSDEPPETYPFSV